MFELADENDAVVNREAAASVRLDGETVDTPTAESVAQTAIDAAKGIANEIHTNVGGADRRCAHTGIAMRLLSPLTARIAELEKKRDQVIRDSDALNALARQAGWGQGEIDSGATIAEENEALRAWAERAKQRLHHDEQCDFLVHEPCSCGLDAIFADYEKLAKGGA